MKESIIRSMETDYKTSTEKLFDRIYLSVTEDSGSYYPSIKLMYMVDDYWELLSNADSD